MKRLFFLAAAILAGGYLVGHKFSASHATSEAAFESMITGQSKLTASDKTWRAPTFANRMSDDLVPSEAIDATLLELAFLPEEKRATVARIVRDAELQEQEIVDSAQGFRTVADEQRIQALQASRNQSIRALLSENEWQTFEERTSSVGLELLGQVKGIPCSPEQFSQLCLAKQALETWINQLNDGVGDARAAAQEKMKELVEQLLGTEGRKAFERNSDPAFAHLESFAQRFQIPNSTAGSIYDQLKVIEALDAQPLDLDRFPDGIDPVREAARAQAAAQLEALMPHNAFSEFAPVWLRP